MKHIAVVGAGLTGPVLSALLARRGYRVTLYERRSDLRKIDSLGGRSINLALAYRGTKALNAIGALSHIGHLSIPLRGRLIHDEHGNTTFLPYGIHADDVIYSVSRNELNRALLQVSENQFGVKIKFKQRCNGLTKDQACRVDDLESGTSYTLDADAIIAADGAGSSIRHALEKKGYLRSQEQVLEHAYKELTIPPELGKPQLSPNALHVWPRGGFMLIALPNQDGSFTATLFLSRKGNPSFQTLTTNASVNAFFQVNFPDVHSLMPNLVNEFASHPVGTLGTIYTSPWQTGRILLIGDAAHAIVPFHGQGMNAAFEDCLILDQCLNDCNDDLPKSFSLFFQKRKDDADAIAAMALENYREMRDTVREPNFMLKKALGFELEKRVPDRFIPRYSLVMFHDTPYAEAKRRGVIQSQLLDKLTKDAKRLEDIDLDAAVDEVKTTLGPTRE